MDAVFPPDVITKMSHWLEIFAGEWHQELPQKLHGRELDDMGAPQWHPEFSRWLLRHETREERHGHRNPDGRLRVTKAMRGLRKEAPRAYEVLYRVMVLGASIESTTQWLNERAIRGGHPERYRNGDTLAIVQAGCHWVEHHY